MVDSPAVNTCSSEDLVRVDSELLIAGVMDNSSDDKEWLPASGQPRLSFSQFSADSSSRSQASFPHHCAPDYAKDAAPADMDSSESSAATSAIVAPAVMEYASGVEDASSDFAAAMLGAPEKSKACLPHHHSPGCAKDAASAETGTSDFASALLCTADKANWLRLYPPCEVTYNRQLTGPTSTCLPKMLPIEDSFEKFPCALMVTQDIIEQDCMPCSGDLASSATYCLLPLSSPRTANTKSHERKSTSTLASPQLPPFTVPSPVNTYERASVPASLPTRACRLSAPPPVRHSCEYDGLPISSSPRPLTAHHQLLSPYPPPRPPTRNPRWMRSPGQTLLILGPNINETDFTPHSDFIPPPITFSKTVDSWGSTEMKNYLGESNARQHALGMSRPSSTRNSNLAGPSDSLFRSSNSKRWDQSTLPSPGRLGGSSLTVSSTRSPKYRGTWHRIMTLNAARELANRAEKGKASGSSSPAQRSLPSWSPLLRSPNPLESGPSNLKGGLGIKSCEGLRTVQQSRHQIHTPVVAQADAGRACEGQNSADSDHFKSAASQISSNVVAQINSKVLTQISSGSDQVVILSHLEPTGQAM
eukprot:gene17601-23932_t